MRISRYKVQATYCIFVALVIVLNFRLGQALMGECKCGAFDNEDTSSEPIIAAILPASMIKIPCSDDGAQRCIQQCDNMGKKVPVNVANTLLCQKVGKTVNIPQIYLFASICDSGEWIQTELKFPKSICCVNGKSVDCNFE